MAASNTLSNMYKNNRHYVKYIFKVNLIGSMMIWLKSETFASSTVDNMANFSVADKFEIGTMHVPPVILDELLFFSFLFFMFFSPDFASLLSAFVYTRSLRQTNMLPLNNRACNECISSCQMKISIPLTPLPSPGYNTSPDKDREIEGETESRKATLVLSCCVLVLWHLR